MKTLLRLIIAIIFIISGFVKAVDTKGFSFKLEEYFSPAVFNIPILEELALPLAIFVVVFEVLLGITLLLKIKLKETLILLISLCIFFAFLTFYSAYYNKVTDCGCFGDALKFTPWQSFWKDIILLVGLLLLWIFYKNEPKYHSSLSKNMVFALSILGFGYIIYQGISQEPIIDFRDYKIGTDLKVEKQKIAQNPSEYKTFYTLRNKQTDEEKEINQDEYVNVEEYWKEGSAWEILEDKTTSKLTKEGYKSEIQKFKIEDEIGNDITEKILNEKKIILVFSYKPSVLKNGKVADKIKSLQAKSQAEIIGISPEPKIFHSIPNATMDATAIKTIARSNPFVLTLENGKITDKQPLKNY